MIKFIAAASDHRIRHALITLLTMRILIHLPFHVLDLWRHHINLKCLVLQHILRSSLRNHLLGLERSDGWLLKGVNTLLVHFPILKSVDRAIKRRHLCSWHDARRVHVWWAHRATLFAFGLDRVVRRVILV